MGMLGRKDHEGLPTTEGVNAFIGKGAAFEGKITFQGMFRVDGKYDGEIASGDSMVIGETGEVNAQINVKNLIVNGKANGNITAKNRIEIHPPGSILGDISTSVLVISEGAVFDGSCHMEKREFRSIERFSPLKRKENETVEKGVGKKGDVGSEAK
jgi:cytoskeletal protein CcmA (bactofilin family)